MFKFSKQQTKMLLIITTVFVLFIFAKENNPLLTHKLLAQTIYPSDGSGIPIPEQIKEIQQQVDISVSPETPKPNDDVTIMIETYGLDLNSTNIQWLINGKEKLKGEGKKVFTFNVGDSGQSTITLNIFPKNQPQITRTFIFNPSNVDLLWQAETYTPPFYKGKALFSPESSVTLVAIPNFTNGNTRVNDSNVVYKWSVDREVMGDNSGYGKNYFKYTADIIPVEKEISVEAYPSRQDTRKGIGSTVLSEKNSFALFYEDNPTNGIMFNYSLTNKINLGKRNESKISVFPYNFSSNSKNSNLNYTWYVNSEKINIPENTNTITIKKNDKEKVDIANVLVKISNPNHIMQTTEGVIDFLFNNN